MFNKKLYILAVPLLFSGVIYSLVFASSEFLSYAEKLAANGIINPQSSEAGYLLQENLLRGQAVKLSLGSAGLGQRDCRTLSSLTFSDVNTSMGDLCGFIEGAVANNIITKTNGFYPYQPISRSNFADLMVRAFDVSTPGLIAQVNSGDTRFSDVPVGLYNANSINRLATTNCINVGGAFRPSDYITRGESFKVMYCLLNKRIGYNSSSASSNTTTSTAPSFPWTIQGVSYTNLADVKAKYPGSCIHINGVSAVFGFGPCVAGTSTNTSSTSSSSSSANSNSTASIPADCPAIPSNFTIVKPGNSLYGGTWKPQSSGVPFIAKIPPNAGVALEYPVVTGSYPAGFKMIDAGGGTSSFVVSRCPGSMVPVDGQDGTVDKNGDGRKDSCNVINGYVRWVNTSGTIPNYFTGVLSYETSCFLSTTTNLGSSTPATYYINIINNSSTTSVGSQYANIGQLQGTLPPPLGNVSTSSNTTTSSIPAFPWVLQGVSYTNLADVKAKYPGSCITINGVSAVFGFGPCVAGTSSSSSSAPTPNPTSNPLPTPTTTQTPADCPAMPSNFTLVKPLDRIYGGWWRPASGGATFVGQLPAGAGVAFEFPVNTAAYRGGFKVADVTGGTKSYVISRCPGSMIPVDGQDGTTDLNNDGKKERCTSQGVYARWVNTSGTIPSYFSGTTYVESLQTTCFLPTTTSLGSSTPATYYINIVNTSATNPVGIQYVNYSQLGTLPPALGTVSTPPTQTNTSPTSSNSTTTTAIPAFPWTIQGVSYTNLTDVKAKYPGSCVYINGVYAVMGFGPCVAGTSSNSSSAPTPNPTTPPTTTTSSIPAFPWVLQGVSYTNLADVKAKYPSSCITINGISAVFGFGPCVAGTSSSVSSTPTPNPTPNPLPTPTTTQTPADCPAMPSNFKIAKSGEVVYGGLWRPASSSSTFVGQLPAGAGVALEFTVNTSTFVGGFRAMDYTGGTKRYAISRCPGSMVPVDGQDGTTDKNGDGKNEKCNTLGVYGRWVNTSGTTPNYFSGTTYVESLQTTCFLPTTTSLGSSTPATYYINVVNTSTTDPVGIQYANIAQLGSLPPPLYTGSASSPVSLNCGTMPSNFKLVKAGGTAYGGRWMDTSGVPFLTQLPVGAGVALEVTPNKSVYPNGFVVSDGTGGAKTYTISRCPGSTVPVENQEYCARFGTSVTWVDTYTGQTNKWTCYLPFTPNEKYYINIPNTGDVPVGIQYINYAY